MKHVYTNKKNACKQTCTRAVKKKHGHILCIFSGLHALYTFIPLLMHVFIHVSHFQRVCVAQQAEASGSVNPVRDRLQVESYK